MLQNFKTGYDLSPDLIVIFFRKRALKRSSLSQIKAEMEIVYNVQGKADEGKFRSKNTGSTSFSYWALKVITEKKLFSEMVFTT